MKLKMKVLSSVALASMMLLTACSSGDSTPTKSTTDTGSSTNTETVENAAPTKLDFFYYDGLRVFKSNSPIWETIQQNLNIQLNGVAPTTPGGDANEQFNLMLASGEIPDIIHANKKIGSASCRESVYVLA